MAAPPVPPGFKPFAEASSMSFLLILYSLSEINVLQIQKEIYTVRMQREQPNHPQNAEKTELDGKLFQYRQKSSGHAFYECFLRSSVKLFRKQRILIIYSLFRFFTKTALSFLWKHG